MQCVTAPAAAGAVNSVSGFDRRWGGHAECLRRRCGDTAGV